MIFAALQWGTALKDTAPTRDYDYCTRSRRVRSYVLLLAAAVLLFAAAVRTGFVFASWRAGGTTSSGCVCVIIWTVFSG